MNTVAIVDYGRGNLFSVKQACARNNLHVEITSSKKKILSADAVILPGVGAFSDAMESLRQLDLVSVLREAATSGKPFLGICLGMQLMMTESHEFGLHQGLGLIEGSVVRFESFDDANPEASAQKLKVPQVGWNQIYPNGNKPWANTLLDGLDSGALMYFVHSYYPQPQDSDITLSVSPYGETEFCSSLRRGSLFGCQFHPERSGHIGLRLYENLSHLIANTVNTNESRSD